MSSKVSTFQEAEARYGKITDNGIWADSYKWIISYDISQFPTLAFLYEGKPITSISINRDMAPALTGALNCLAVNNLGSEIKTYDGSFHIRTVSGKSTKLSTHSYGLAIDINAGQYPRGTAGRQHPKLVQCFTDQGFRYGIDFPTPDPHHFSYSWE